MHKLKSFMLNRSPKTLLIAGTVIIAGAIGASVFAYTHQSNLANNKTTAQQQPVKKTVDQPKDTQETPKPAGAEQATETTPQSTQPKTNTSHSQAAPTQPAPNTQPFSGPFAISSVSLQGASWSCSGGVVVVYAWSAQVYASSIVGGTFAWQLEITGAYDPYAPYSANATIPKNQVSYQLNGFVQPGPLYSGTSARDGQSVRVHITSPNDVASAWFTVPAGAQDSCRNS